MINFFFCNHVIDLLNWGSVLFYFSPLNESQGIGEEWELHLGGGVGKVGPTPKGRQTICFALDVVLGVGRAKEGHSTSTPTRLCPDPGN